MDLYIRNLLKKNIFIGKHRTEVSEILFLAVITLLAAGVRISVRSFVADDWSIYWSDWLIQLQQGGFRALADDFYDYAPPVMYILYLITLLPVNAMTAFKGLCCVLEILGAVLIGAIVRECTGSRKKAELAYGVFLFLPTVILNAAVWSQCDIIYTVLILCCAYFLLKNRTWTAMWFYGAAFAVKLQTLFIFPFLVILWVRRKVDLKHFITIPVMYLVGILPAWIAGRPFMELLGIYAFQGSKDRWSLSIKFPNIYQIIGNNFFLDEYVSAGMYLILGILMLVMFYMAYQKVRVTKEYVILMIVFFGMLTTYFLPHMHERYLYLTDAFLLIYVLIRVQRFPWFVMASFLTVVGYGQYLTKQTPTVAYGVLAFLQLLLLVRIGLDLYGYFHDPAYQLAEHVEEERRILE
jgi:Gpi18-like mannosyltransferase